MTKIKTSLDITACFAKTLYTQLGFDFPLNVPESRLRAIAEDVKEISTYYTKQNSPGQSNVLKSDRLLSAYLSYYLPVNIVKLFPVLDELASFTCLPFNRAKISVLDLGCGPGTYLLGFLEYLAKNFPVFPVIPERIYLTGIDRNKKNLRIAENMISSYFKSSTQFSDKLNGGLKFINNSFFRKDPVGRGERYDLIIAGNFITELNEEGIQLFVRFIDDHVAMDGAIIIIDPGTRASSQNLIRMKEIIQQETSLNLYGPCPRPGVCPMPREKHIWCHEKLSWIPPEIVEKIDLHTGFSKQKGIKYSYLTFLKKPVSVSGVFPDHDPAKIYRVVSYLIKTKGLERIYVCNGSCKLLLRRMNKNSSNKNTDFSLAKRGDFIMFKNCKDRDNFLDVLRDSSFKILVE